MAKKSRPSLVNKSKESIVATPATSEIKEKVKAHKVQTKSLKTKFSSKSKGKSLELPKIVEKPTVNEMLAQYEYFLQAICDHEKNSIQEILTELKEQNPKNQLALDEFEKVLQNYLNDFMNKFHEQYPKENEGNENHPLVFLPEFSSQEFETLKHQQKQLQVQTQFLEVLNQYEQDLNLLRQNENLWIGKVPAQEHDITVSEHVVGTSQRYLEILNSMEQSCDKILDVCNATKKQTHQSRDLQDQLYDNFESLRESMTLTEKPPNHIPKDAKDLLKGFPKYLK